MNAPDRNLHDEADGKLREQAIESLSEKIKSGKSRIGIFELLDSELNTDRAKILLEEITTLLLNESGEREAMADKMVADLIARHLSTQGDLIEEESAAIEAEESDDVS